MRLEAEDKEGAVVEGRRRRARAAAAKRRRSGVTAVNAVEVSAADARYDQVMDMMSRVLQGQKEADEKICAMTEKREEEKKEKEELSWEARAKEQEEEIARLKAQAAGGGGAREAAQGKEEARARVEQATGRSGGYQPMGQTPGSPDYTGCNRCGSMEHKGMDCPRNPRNRQQGGYQQGGYQPRFSGGIPRKVRPGWRRRLPRRRRRLPTLPGAAGPPGHHGQGASSKRRAAGWR